MDSRRKGIELKVGIFVCVGLAVLAGLVVQFGRVGEGFKSYYDLTVHFPDASGLLKGSDVLMAGAKIGRVSGGPRLVPGGDGVAVPLRIYDFVKIPANSRFVVGSSGLLGDRYVSVWMPAGKPSEFLHPNAMVTGFRETGMDDLTREGGHLVADLRNTVKNIDTTVTRLNEQALSSGNMENLRTSIENLSRTTGALADSAEKIDGVMGKAGEAMGASARAAAEVQEAVGDMRETIEAATAVIRKATTGNGMVATLLTNEKLARDLEALVSNMRAHGVLFYRDSIGKAEARAQRERETSTNQRRQRR